MANRAPAADHGGVEVQRDGLQHLVRTVRVKRGVPEDGGIVDPAGEGADTLCEVGGPLHHGLVGGITDHADRAGTGGMAICPGQRRRVELDGDHGVVVGVLEKPLDDRATDAAPPPVTTNERLMLASLLVSDYRSADSHTVSVSQARNPGDAHKYRGPHRG